MGMPLINGGECSKKKNRNTPPKKYYAMYHYLIGNAAINQSESS